MAECWKEVRASYSYVLQGFGTIHVGNIPPEVTPQRLKIYFETFGPVANVSIRQTGTQYSTYQYGFVTFEKESDAEKALSGPHHSVHFEGIKVKRWNQPAEDRSRCPMDHMSILGLNDDCLYEIASKLLLVDLLRLSQVCQRFKYIADFLFSKCRNLDARLLGKCTSMEIREIMSRVRPYVQKVKYSDKDAMNVTILFEHYLPKFSSKIRELSITGMHPIYYGAYRHKFKKFKNLTVLSLSLCDITDDLCELISKCKNIENLNLSQNSKITGKYLYKLIKLKILNLRSCPNLQSLHFNELLAIVKLESLNIEHCMSLNSSSIEHILRHQTELVTLTVAKESGTPDLHPLAKLKSLKNLEVCVDDSDLILEELAFHNTGVEKLNVSCLIRGMQLKATRKKAILNLKNLKELCIECIDDSFINQIASRTSLRYLCCAGFHSVTSKGLLKLIRKSNTIEKIDISLRPQFNDELIFKAIDILKEKQSVTRLTFIVKCHAWTIESIQMNLIKRSRCPVKKMEGPETENFLSDQISILDLNDDCLIKIASKLPLVDLLRLSQVCQRFEYIAEFLFSKCKKLDARLFGKYTSMEIREIMLRVGPYVQKVICLGRGAMNAGKQFLDCLTELCSNSRTLECCTQGRYFELYRIFKNLTVLSLPLCDITDDICELISNCENIENLNLSGNPTITGKYLHKLIKLKILNLRSCPNLQSLHFNELLANVKLESLNIEHCMSLNSSSIEHILRHQTELVTLSVTKESGSPDLHPLAKLKSLKNLEVCVDDSDLILEELAFHNTGLEKLKITCEIPCVKLKASQKEAISNLKNLKELCIEGIDDSFINQIASRTFLRHLCCAGCYNVSSDGILNLIRISNTIEKIDISSRLQFRDEQAFKAIDILKEKQRATRLTFVKCCYTRIIKSIQMVNKFLRTDLVN